MLAMMQKTQLILLHPDDNVLVVISRISAGDTFMVENRPVLASVAIEVGHKLARAKMPAGERIFRYGAPIGSLTREVKAGEHIHTHNMKSDYITSHDRDAVTLKKQNDQD